MRRDIITGLPASRHQTDHLQFGRDGRLYIGQGSRSDHGELVCIAPLEGTVLVAYEGEQHRAGLREALSDVQPTVSLFIGPEGGFAREEVACAREAGARLITLGPRILRSETAAPLLAALVLYELGDLSFPRDDA